MLAGHDLADVREGRLPPEVKSRVIHARLVGALNLAAGLLSYALMEAVVWFFGRAFR